MNEDVLYINASHNGISFSREKGGHPAICSNMDGPGARFAK